MLSSRRSQNFLIFSLPLSMICALVLLTATKVFKENSEILSIGVSLDLLIIVPLVYFLLIRKTNIPKTTIVPLIFFGLLIGKYIIPKEHQYYLDLFKTWGLPVLEVFVLGFVSYKVFKAIQTYKQNNRGEADFYSVLKNTCKETFPGFAVIPVVTEIAVFYYGFLNWKDRDLQENEFSYHKESGSIPLLSIIIFLIIVETLVLHILLAMWSETVAWILTFLSLYSLIQLFGFTRSLNKRPINLDSEKLYLRYGIMSEAIIDIRDIRSIEISSRDIELNSETVKLSFLGNLESHNLILHLNKENFLTGLYGRKKTFMTIALHVDEKAKFKAQIEEINS